MERKRKNPDFMITTDEPADHFRKTGHLSPKPQNLSNDPRRQHACPGDIYVSNFRPDRTSELPVFVPHHDPRADHGRRRGTVQIGEGSGNKVTETFSRKMPMVPATKFGEEWSRPFVHRRHGKQPEVHSVGMPIMGKDNGAMRVGRAHSAASGVRYDVLGSMRRLEAILTLTDREIHLLERSLWSEFGIKFDLMQYTHQLLALGEDALGGRHGPSKVREFERMYNKLDGAFHKKHIEPNPLHNTFYHSRGVA